MHLSLMLYPEWEDADNARKEQSGSIQTKDGMIIEYVTRNNRCMLTRLCTTDAKAYLSCGLSPGDDVTSLVMKYRQ